MSWKLIQENKRRIVTSESNITTLQTDVSTLQTTQLVKVKEIEITSAPDGTEQDAGWDIPTKSVVLDVFIDVTAAEATGTTKTLDVGLLSTEVGGDANGFLAAVDVSTTGIKKGTLLNTGQTKGALLAVDEDGAGVLVPEGHPCNGTAVSVSYTAASVDWVEFRGSLFVVYVDLS